MTNNQNFENQGNTEQAYVDKQKVDMFIMSNQKYFPADKIIFMKEKLYKIDESKFTLLSCIEMKDPTTLLLVSIFLGSLGIDRFMLKETGMGVLKLLTGGVCGILTIIDWFGIQNKTKEMNFRNLMMMVWAPWDKKQKYTFGLVWLRVFFLLPLP